MFFNVFFLDSFLKGLKQVKHVDWIDLLILSQSCFFVNCDEDGDLMQGCNQQTGPHSYMSKFGLMESSIRAYPGLPKALPSGCKTR